MEVLPLPIANSLGPAVDSFVKYAKNLLEKLGELFAKVEVKEVLELGDDVAFMTTSTSAGATTDAAWEDAASCSSSAIGAMMRWSDLAPRHRPLRSF